MTELQSTVHELWAEPKTGDVYYGLAATSHAIKDSYHRSGRFHLAYTKRHLAEGGRVVSPGGPSERVVAMWTAPSLPVPNLHPLCVIVVPSGDLGAPVESQSYADVRWHEASPGLDVVYSVLIAGAGVSFDGWPGKNAGSELVAQIPLGSAAQVWLIAVDVDAELPADEMARYREASLHELVARSGLDASAPVTRAWHRIQNPGEAPTWIDFLVWPPPG